MTLVSFISRRFNARKTLPRSIRAMRAVAIAGVSIAVAALVVATSIGRGFESRYRHALLDFNAHVIVMGSGETEEAGATAAIGDVRYASNEDRAFSERFRWLIPWRERAGALFSAAGRLHSAIARWDARLAAVSRQGLTGQTPFLYREALAVGGGGITGVVVKGVEASTMESVNAMPIHLFEGKASLREALSAREGEAPPAVVGRALANLLGAGEGTAEAKLLIPREGKARGGRDPFQRIRIVGTFESGMHDYDAQFLLMSLPVARRFFDAAPEAVTGIELKLDDPEKATAVADALRLSLGPRYSVVTWWELNRDLLSAVRLEQQVSSLIMGIMVVVAALNIVAVLVLMAIYRLHEISVLKALGLSDRSVEALFIRGGGIVGVVGAAIGLAAGVGLSLALGRFHLVPLEAEIYLISAVPVDISAVICGIIALFCLGVGYVTSWLASRTLAAVPVAEGLRIAR